MSSPAPRRISDRAVEETAGTEGRGNSAPRLHGFPVRARGTAP
ncbi:hypothetical protein [Streptomyces sp. NRRL S-118]|nr:hypothetical protein [Streptomyces sp. NRRL S-118]